MFDARSKNLGNPSFNRFIKAYQARHRIELLPVPAGLPASAAAEASTSASASASASAAANASAAAKASTSPYAYVTSATTSVAVDGLNVSLVSIDAKGAICEKTITMAEHIENEAKKFNIVIPRTVKTKGVDGKEHLMVATTAIVGLPLEDSKNSGTARYTIQWTPANIPSYYKDEFTSHESKEERSLIEEEKHPLFVVMAMGFKQIKPTVFEPIKLDLLPALKQLCDLVQDFTQELAKKSIGTCSPSELKDKLNNIPEIRYKKIIQDIISKLNSDTKEVTIAALNEAINRIRQDPANYIVDKNAYELKRNNHIKVKASKTIITATAVQSETVAEYGLNRSDRAIKAALTEITDYGFFILLARVQIGLPKPLAAPQPSPPLDKQEKLISIQVQLPNGRCLTVLLPPSATGKTLKQKIFESEGKHPQQQKLFFRGQQIQARQKLPAIQPTDTIYVRIGERTDEGSAESQATQAELAAIAKARAQIAADAKRLNTLISTQSTRSTTTIESDAVESKEVVAHTDMYVLDFTAYLVQQMVLVNEIVALPAATKKAAHLLSIAAFAPYKKDFFTGIDLIWFLFLEYVCDFHSPLDPLGAALYAKQSAAFRATPLISSQVELCVFHDSVVSEHLQQFAREKKYKGFIEAFIRYFNIPYLLYGGKIYSCQLNNSNEFVIPMDFPILTPAHHQNLLRKMNQQFPGLIIWQHFENYNLRLELNALMLPHVMDIIFKQMHPAIQFIPLNAGLKDSKDTAQLEEVKETKEVKDSKDMKSSAEPTPVSTSNLPPKLLSDHALLCDLITIFHHVNTLIEEDKKAEFYPMIAHQHVALQQVKQLLSDYNGTLPGLKNLKNLLDCLPDVLITIKEGQTTHYSVRDVHPGIANGWEALKNIYTAYELLYQISLVPYILGTEVEWEALSRINQSIPHYKGTHSFLNQALDNSLEELKKTLQRFPVESKNAVVSVEFKNASGVLVKQRKAHPIIPLAWKAAMNCHHALNHALHPEFKRSAFEYKLTDTKLLQDAEAAKKFLQTPPPKENAEYAQIALHWQEKNYTVGWCIDFNYLFLSMCQDYAMAAHVLTSSLATDLSFEEVFHFYKTYVDKTPLERAEFTYLTSNTPKPADVLIKFCDDEKNVAAIEDVPHVKKLLTLQTSVQATGRFFKPFKHTARDPRHPNQMVKYFLSINQDPYDVLLLPKEGSTPLTVELITDRYTKAYLQGRSQASGEGIHKIVLARELALHFIEYPHSRIAFEAARAELQDTACRLSR